MNEALSFVTNLMREWAGSKREVYLIRNMPLCMMNNGQTDFEKNFNKSCATNVSVQTKKNDVIFGLKYTRFIAFLQT